MPAEFEMAFTAVSPAETIGFVSQKRLWPTFSASALPASESALLIHLRSRQ
jgi:hypothetical protein